MNCTTPSAPDWSNSPIHPNDAVPNLTVRDRVFIAGRLPADSSILEQGRPRSRLSGPEIKYFERAERARARHYQCVRMAAWAGEVEVATFLHATIRGRMLFVEFVATVMPGILAEYHEIDTYERLDAGTVLGRWAGRSSTWSASRPHRWLSSGRPVTDPAVLPGVRGGPTHQSTADVRLRLSAERPGIGDRLR